MTAPEEVRAVCAVLWVLGVRLTDEHREFLLPVVAQEPVW